MHIKEQNKSAKQSFNNRGRIQAQGEKLEQSEPWAQNSPPTKKEGLQMTDNLKNKIPNEAAKIRSKEFVKLKKFIRQAAKNGGITEGCIKTFLVKGTEKERVDLEVIKGFAFIDN